MHSVRVPGRVAEDGASASADRRYVGNRVGCAAIVSAAAVMLGLSVHHGVQDTTADFSRPAIKKADAHYRLEECTYRAIRSELPEGATVFVAHYGHGKAVRLVDLETLWTVPQTSAATAQWVLSAGPGRPCSQRALVTQHR